MAYKGWFDEQIKNRIRYDEDSLAHAFARLSSVVLGDSAIAAGLNTDRLKTMTAVGEILNFYGLEPADIPDSVEDMNDHLEYLLRPGGIMRRAIRLEGDWWKDAAGPMLGQTVNGDTVALIPTGFAGYSFFDYGRGQRVKVTGQTRALITADAYCFYRPFPAKELGLRDLAVFLVNSLSRADYGLIIAASLAVSLLGLFTPYVTQLIFSRILPSGKISLLLPVAVLLLGVMLSTALIGITRTMLIARLQTKMSMDAEAAAMSRLLSLPAAFFKEENAGFIASRLSAMDSLCGLLTGTLLSTTLAALFSVVYLFQIFNFAPALLVPAVVILAVQLLLTSAASLMQLKIARCKMVASARLQGFTLAVIAGIQKIKLAGAERRIFARWADTYKEQASLVYNPPLMLKIQPVLASLVSLGGTVVIYYYAAAASVSIADYMAFSASFGMVGGAILSLAMVATGLANIRPLMEMLEPILKTVPETGENKEIVVRLAGNIEINNLSFRYSQDMPLVLDDISLKIRAGEYVAVVGRTGCGKSTLMRLLLGFEVPQKGAVYYDGRDLAKLDLRSVRQNIGSVLQNGRLFNGDIFSNIIVSAPWLSMDEAWQAAELAGIADDIRTMPMGMHTMISEGGGGISGGQRQRLMIARAIVPKPRILIFDEATSALDNITQKQVSAALDKLNSTRIVIAHRLSTIINCDRIIVLDQGKIKEDGSYAELMERGGYFAELVERQRLDEDSFAGPSTRF